MEIHNGNCMVEIHNANYKVEIHMYVFNNEKVVLIVAT
jgi:hypothetical protein